MERWHPIIWTIPLVLTLHIVYCTEAPLLLTPYLETGKIEEAQAKALVTPDFGGVKSYTGFFTVNKECSKNLFFWFVPAKNNWETSPVLLWVAAGLITSSLIGLFSDIGPYDYNRNDGFTPREYAWTTDNNVIFLDFAVGSGFSYTEKECYPKNLTMVVDDVYPALVQFFTMFPILQKNKFFLVGQSNAGHFMPAIAWEIHTKNIKASLKINLIGVLIGNPYIDLRCNRANFDYELGIIDEKIRDLRFGFEKNIAKFIDAQNYTGARNYIYNLTWAEDGLPSTANVLSDTIHTCDFETHLRNFKVRKQIHVGRKPYYLYGDNSLNRNLSADIYMPVNYYVEKLLQTNKYIMGFYSGHLDSSNPYTAVPCVLRQLKWPGLEDYLKANKTTWYVGGRLAGWIKTAGNMFEVVVRNSGLSTAREQPQVTLTLITAATSDTPGNGNTLLSDLQTTL